MDRETQRILILFAHPALQKSRVNRALIRAVQNMDGVTFHDLYESYPEFDIDADYERKLLLEHDLFIFQYPFFWYSAPAILKEWQDLVLVHGWAYGHNGNSLHGKTMFNVISTGGDEASYRKDGYNRFTMPDLLAPIEQTAYLCGMNYLPPFVVHGTFALTDEEIRKHADDYQRTVMAFRDGRIDVKAARNFPRLNARLDKIIKGG